MNLICGINPVVEALRAGSRHFDRLLIVKGLRNKRISDAIALASQGGVPLRFEPREALDRLASGTPHQGIIAVVSEKSVLSLHDLLAQSKEPGLFVVLDGVEDPRNLGAILRTAEAAGADGVLIPERHSASLSETVARASAGALEHVKVARVGNLVQAIEALKARNVWVVGFDASGKERWDAVDLKRPIALVLGGEGKGIRRLVREHCDHVVSLPLLGHVESLNVSVAAGIALYEAVRQRGLAASHVKPIPPRPKTATRLIVGPAADDLEHDPGAGDHARQLADAVQDDVEIEEDNAWDVTAPHGLDDQREPSRGAPQRAFNGAGQIRPEREGGRGGDRKGRGDRHGRGERHGRGDKRERGEHRGRGQRPERSEGSAPSAGPTAPSAGATAPSVARGPRRIVPTVPTAARTGRKPRAATAAINATSADRAAAAAGAAQGAPRAHPGRTRTSTVSRASRGPSAVANRAASRAKDRPTRGREGRPMPARDPAGGGAGAARAPEAPRRRIPERHPSCWGRYALVISGFVAGVAQR